MNQGSEITSLLGRWRDGEEEALAALMPLVYDELLRRARAAFRGERPGHTLQPTALVHEAFDRLAGAGVAWQDRAHFFALSGRLMRRILVDHARAKLRDKRGAGAERITLDVSKVGDGGSSAALLDLHEALEHLGERSARQAELIEMQYFGGLTFADMQEATGLSSSTIDRELRFARAWLNDRLADDLS